MLAMAVENRALVYQLAEQVLINEETILTFRDNSKLSTDSALNKYVDNTIYPSLFPCINQIWFC